MATSTFSKNFAVKQDMAKDFVMEMKKAVAPTLQRNFQSNLSHLNSETDLRKSVLRALNK